MSVELEGTRMGLEGLDSNARGILQWSPTLIHCWMVGTSEHCLRTVEIYPKNRALSVVRLTQSGSRLSLLIDIKRLESNSFRNCSVSLWIIR